MMAASAATGFRSWLQNHHFGWLTPKRIRALTIAAMVAAGFVSTVGISGSSVPRAHGASVHLVAAPVPGNGAPTMSWVVASTPRGRKLHS
jgi:hypothetical protein